MRRCRTTIPDRRLPGEEKFFVAARAECPSGGGAAGAHPVGGKRGEPPIAPADGGHIARPSTRTRPQSRAGCGSGARSPQTGRRQWSARRRRALCLRNCKSRAPTPPPTGGGGPPSSPVPSPALPKNPKSAEGSLAARTALLPPASRRRGAAGTGGDPPACGSRLQVPAATFERKLVRFGGPVRFPWRSRQSNGRSRSPCRAALIGAGVLVARPGGSNRWRVGLSTARSPRSGRRG